MNGGFSEVTEIEYPAELATAEPDHVAAVASCHG
jgi:hypothetical protein